MLDRYRDNPLTPREMHEGFEAIAFLLRAAEVGATAGAVGAVILSAYDQLDDTAGVGLMFAGIVASKGMQLAAKWADGVAAGYAAQVRGS